MIRTLAAVAAGLLAAGAVLTAGEPGKVTITYHGQSFFEIKSSKGTNIVIDPHQIQELGRYVVKKADLILISHPHTDHTQVDVVENFRKTKIILGWTGKGKAVNWNIVDEKFKDLRIQSVGSYHDDVQGMMRGKNTIFIIEVDGMRIVHLGDLGHILSPKQVKAIGKVDVLMVPIGG